MTRDDIRGWFSKPNEAALKEIMTELGVKNVIEIGSFLGASTAFFAEQGCEVLAIDPFVIWPDFINDGQPRGDLEENFFPEFCENMEELGIEQHVFPIVATSEQAHRFMPKASADLVYLDGAHDYDSVLQDIKLWRSRAGKVICGDDYSEHWPGVIQAVDEVFGKENVTVTGDSLWSVKI